MHILDDGRTADDATTCVFTITHAELHRAFDGGATDAAVALQLWQGCEADVQFASHADGATPQTCAALSPLACKRMQL